MQTGRRKTEKPKPENEKQGIEIREREKRMSVTGAEAAKKKKKTETADGMQPSKAPKADGQQVKSRVGKWLTVLMLVCCAAVSLLMLRLYGLSSAAGAFTEAGAEAEASAVLAALTESPLLQLGGVLEVLTALLFLAESWRFYFLEADGSLTALCLNMLKRMSMIALLCAVFWLSGRLFLHRVLWFCFDPLWQLFPLFLINVILAATVLRKRRHPER